MYGKHVNVFSAQLIDSAPPRALASGEMGTRNDDDDDDDADGARVRCARTDGKFIFM